MTSQELARREALQPELQQAGVEIVTDAEGRYRSIEFPEQLREQMNVLMPVSEIVQADPNYTPSIRAVRLDPRVDAKTKGGIHFYNQGSANEPRLAPTKQALEILADLAGVQLAAVRPLRREELEAHPEGSFGYEATIQIRRSDGTPRTITRSRVWDSEVEREKIIEQVAKLNKPDAEKQAEFRRRWLQEREHGKAKTESKAVLRAIRAALQIPHTFSAEDAKKPFVVVGYSFTPDYSDPEIRRLVVERGLAASGEVFGRELGAGSPMPGDEPDAEAAAAADAAAPRAGEASERTPPDSPAPAFEGEEPPPAAEAAEPEPEKAVVDEADYVLPAAFTRFAGKTLGEVDDDAYLAWLASDTVKDATTREAARAFLAARKQ